MTFCPPEKRPFEKMLQDYANSDAARFHMPGHKGLGLEGTPLSAIQGLDITELSFSDNLHSPESSIKALQYRFAKVYGQAGAYLLVNGSTAGVIAMLLAIGDRKRILVARNCHRSAVNGLMLANHECVPLFAHDGIVTAEAVGAALEKHNCDAALITSPDYYGRCCDTDKIAEVCHRHSAALLVDAAHGAHFAFSNRLPSVPSKADLWVTSCHKTMCALTQSGVLFMGKDSLVSPSEVKKALSAIQTTSPSYLLMLSLETALNFSDFWEKHIERIQGVRKRLHGIAGIRLYDGDEVFYDTTRLHIGVNDGFAAKKLLEDIGIFVEMADTNSLLLITSPFDKDEWYERLLNALSCLTAYNKEACERTILVPSSAADAFSVREAFFAETEAVGLDAAEGRICAESTGIYPPGIALLFPGERITAQALKLLGAYLNTEAEFFGLSAEKKVYCIKEEHNI